MQIRAYVNHRKKAPHFLLLLYLGWLGFLSLEVRGQSPLIKANRRSVSLEWQAMEEASKYELELTPIKENKKITHRLIRFKTSKTYWDGYIAPGLYSMRLRSLDVRGVPGEWSEPEEVTVRFQKIGDFLPVHQTTFNSKQNESEEVSLSWGGFPGALSFEVRVWSKDKSFEQIEKTSATEIKIKVPVAKDYSWTVHPIKVAGVESDPNEDVLDFSVVGKRLESAVIVSPSDDFVRSIQWTKIPYAETYKVLIEQYDKKKDTRWNTLKDYEQTQNQFPFELTWPGGLYRVTVTGLARGRLSSESTSLEFKVRHGDRTEEGQYRFLLAQAKKRTNNWFAIASYLITEVKYSAINYDYGSKPSARVLGGTGRLGLGFLSEKSSWGFLGIIDQSGFILERQRHTFSALEGLGIYRASITYNSETRLSAGIFYKEVPELLVSGISGGYLVSQLKMFGPQVGLEQLVQFNEKWGAQIHARIYLPLRGSTPNQQPLVSAPNYQYGILGSLRLSPKVWGYAGYAYRKDAIKYKSSYSSEGQFNETSITGNYLNLYLEWGF